MRTSGASRRAAGGKPKGARRDLKLPLVARGAALRKLEATGVARTRVRVTYTPDGGTPKKVTETVTLHG